MIVHDVTETGLRVEVEGHPHRFGGQAAGQVRAGTPAMVVAIHVEAGQQVAAGQPLGVLEAMKTEIGFEAPVSGVVTEVRVRRGQQVAAGEVLLVIDPRGRVVRPRPRSGSSLRDRRSARAALARAGAAGSEALARGGRRRCPRRGRRRSRPRARRRGACCSATTRTRRARTASRSSSRLRSPRS
jgi:pyruvate/2-oxoglutarate dehydrogenase complex dihydrolipoamide acyltransferase (E2) component